MARTTLLGLPLRSICRSALFAAALVVLDGSPVAAQRPVGHVVVPPHGPIAGRVAMPRVVPQPVFHPPVFSPRPVSARVEPTFVFRTGPFPFPHRHRFFFAEPFFFGAQFWLQPYWLTNCGAMLAWDSGCYTLPAYPESSATYLVPQPYAVPVYIYGEERPDEVQLFMKDGTIYNVTDYWFVNDEIHFTLLQELPNGGYRNVERAVAADQLDFQTTLDVNTRRGFRMVRRDAPWRKYLQEHPDATPPPLTAVPDK